MIRPLQSLSDRNRDARFVWRKAVSDDARHEVDHEVGNRAMAGVLDLAQVFQLVKDGFDDAVLAQEGLIEGGQVNGFHVFSELGHQTNAVFLQPLGEPFGPISLVGIEGAKQAVTQLAQGLAVIDIAGRQFDGEQFADMVDHHMQLEAEKPAGRGFATRRASLKNAMATDAQVVTDGQGG